MAVKKTNSELRKFGLVMTVPLALIGGLALWHGKPAALWLFGAAGFFLVAGLLIPRALAPIERVWMAFAHVLSIVMTHVILTLSFYLVITPMGLLLRLMRKDLLRLKFDRKPQTYWIDVKPDGPGSRPDKPY